MLEYELINNSKNEYIVLLHGYGGNSKCFKKQITTLSQFFNIVLIDLHGHGKSSNIHLDKDNFSLKQIVRDIDLTLNKLGIKTAHFMGLSLGTIITTVYTYYYPQKVSSILNAGAVIKFKPCIKLCLSIIYKFIDKLPYKFLYRIAGHIIMPYKSHKISRDLFIREAKKMNLSDFSVWGKVLIDFQGNYNINIKNKDIKTLYISGKDDYFFISEVREYCNNYNKKFILLNNAGHICNIDNYTKFNKIIEDFYSNVKNND